MALSFLFQLRFQFLFIGLSLSVGLPAAAQGPEQPCEPVQGSSIQLVPDGKSLSDILKKIGSPSSHFIDSVFMLQSTKQSNGALSVQGVDIPSIQADPQTLSRVYGILDATSGRVSTFSAPFAPATSFQDMLSKLATQKDVLSTREKFLYLSMLGSRLNDGYDYSMHNTNLENVFQNLKSQGSSGGVCGDIHSYLSQAAEALGFTEAGVHSGSWRIKGADYGHFLLHFRDSKTGEYYVQNYGGLVATGAKTLTDAIDVSARILSPISTSSLVGSKPGVFHAYSPRTARWVEDELNHAGGFRPDEAFLTGEVGTNQRSLGIKLQSGSTRSEKTKAFFYHKDIDEPEGRFSIDAIGQSSMSASSSGAALNGLIDEVSYASKSIYGLQHVGVPMLAPGNGGGADWSTTGFFLSAGEKRTARINAVTGKFEVQANIVDLTVSKNPNFTNSVQFRPGLEVRPKGALLGVEAERLIENGRHTAALKEFAFTTTYDKVSVVLDKRGKDPRAWIIYRGEVYYMEGLDKMSAKGVRQSIEASLPAGNLGEFSIIADMSRMIENPAADPFYESAPSSSIQAAWKKTLVQATEMGAQIRVNKNAPYFMFERPGTVTPGLVGNEGRTVQGAIWLRRWF